MCLVPSSQPCQASADRLARGFWDAQLSGASWGGTPVPRERAVSRALPGARGGSLGESGGQMSPGGSGAEASCATCSLTAPSKCVRELQARIGPLWGCAPQWGWGQASLFIGLVQTALRGAQSRCVFPKLALLQTPGLASDTFGTAGRELDRLAGTSCWLGSLAGRFSLRFSASA